MKVRILQTFPYSPDRLHVRVLRERTEHDLPLTATQAAGFVAAGMIALVEPERPGPEKTRPVTGPRRNH